MHILFTFDFSSYQHRLRAKLTELHDLVESNLVEAANHQKSYYDKHTKVPSFTVNDKVWLSVAAAKMGRWMESNISEVPSDY